MALNVAESGYCVGHAIKGFIAKHPDILQGVANSGTPCTNCSTMAASPRFRRDRRSRPFAGRRGVNLRGNGARPRQSIVALDRLTDVGITVWITADGSFPNSLIDCLVPSTGPSVPASHDLVKATTRVPRASEHPHAWPGQRQFRGGRDDQPEFLARHVRCSWMNWPDGAAAAMRANLCG